MVGLVWVGGSTLLGFAKKNPDHQIQEVLDGFFGANGLFDLSAALFWDKVTLAIKFAFAKYHAGIFLAGHYDFLRYSLGFGGRHPRFLACGGDGFCDRSGDGIMEYS